MSAHAADEAVAGESNRNPWPCARCGVSVWVPRRAGRLPFGALVSAAAATGLLWFGLPRWGAGVGFNWLLVLLALVLLVTLSIRRRAAAVWRCPRCDLRTGARLRPAGIPLPVLGIPIYNNVGSITDVVRRARKAAPDLPIVVVDDGSTDGSGDRARQATGESDGGRGMVLTHRRNLGKGAALRSLLHHALKHGYSHVIAFDGDGQHQPEDIPAMVSAIGREPSAIWVGSRDLSGENVGGASRFGRRFSNFWLRVLSGGKVDDSQCGFRAYPVAPVLSLGCRARAFDFEVEVLTLAARAGVPLRSLPIDVFYPPSSERVSHFNKFWDNLRISWVNTRLLLGLPLWFLGWPARFSAEDPPMALPRPWSGRSRGGALGHLIFLSLVRFVGPRPAYALLYPVAFYFMFAAGGAVRSSREFLDRVQGPAPSRWKSFWRTYRHMLTFAQCILDRIIVQVRGSKDFTSTADGHEHLTPQSTGAIYLSAHLGNYEVAGNFLAIDDVPINVVMVDAEAEAIKRVYARFDSTRFKPKIIAINRSEFPALKVLAALRAHEAVALHGDRIVDSRWVWCDFLGKRAAFPTGVFLIAAAARVPIVLTFGFKDAALAYHFVAEAPRQIELPRRNRDAAIEEHVRWYASRVEHFARAYPMQWFNFYDFWAEPEVRSESEAKLPD